MLLPLIANSARSPEFANIDVPIWAWVALVAVIIAMLAIDLIRHRDHVEPTFRSALTESVVWTLVGLVFAAVIFVAFGGAAFGEYFSGYLIERTLSFDNVFVWSVLFTAFATPLRYQHRVLFWGIFGALVLRAIFIGLGVALISKFWLVLVLFGLFLIYTGVKIFGDSDESDGEAGQAKMPGIRLLRRFLPVTETYDDGKFLTRVGGRRAATPLLAALVVIELSDVLFAVDSVPATLAVIREPFLIFSSNAFAILGLRAMYFLLADAKERFHYLSTALGVVLIFIGVKMTISHWIHIGTPISLVVIVGCLVVGIWASLRRPKAV